MARLCLDVGAVLRPPGAFLHCDEVWYGRYAHVGVLEMNHPSLPVAVTPIVGVKAWEPRSKFLSARPQLL